MNQLKAAAARTTREPLVVALLLLAAVAWWLTAALDARMRAESMSGMAASMSVGAFLPTWALMMAAMMLPAVSPVVRLYHRAAADGRVAPTGFFVGAYLAVWTLSGLPAYLLWTSLAMPLAESRVWALRLAGAILVLAGTYQLTPLKRACLRHCRTPMSAFLRLRGSLLRPGGAVRAGLMHAGYCSGCCVGLMVVLVATAAMSLWWAVLIAAGVLVERTMPRGPDVATGLGIGFLTLGAGVVIHPPILSLFI